MLLYTMINIKRTKDQAGKINKPSLKENKKQEN